MDEGRREPLETLVEHGSEIVGGAGGAGVGLLLGGPPGAVVGGATGPILVATLRRAGSELAKRFLGPREQIRAGAALLWAATKAQENLDTGAGPRTDGFFAERPDGRSAADELVEGVLLVAQRSYEERKVRFLGYLMANLGFADDIDPAHANYLLRIGERLSYRQLCYLSLVGQNERFRLPSQRWTGSLDSPAKFETWAAFQCAVRRPPLTAMAQVLGVAYLSRPGSTEPPASLGRFIARHRRLVRPAHAALVALWNTVRWGKLSA